MYNLSSMSPSIHYFSKKRTRLFLNHLTFLICCFKSSNFTYQVFSFDLTPLVVKCNWYNSAFLDGSSDIIEVLPSSPVSGYPLRFWPNSHNYCSVSNTSKSFIEITFLIEFELGNVSKRLEPSSEGHVWMKGRKRKGPFGRRTTGSGRHCDRDLR